MLTVEPGTPSKANKLAEGVRAGCVALDHHCILGEEGDLGPAAYSVPPRTSDTVKQSDGRRLEKSGGPDGGGNDATGNEPFL